VGCRILWRPASGGGHAQLSLEEAAISDWTRKLPARADLAVRERLGEDQPPACDADAEVAESLREGLARLETVFGRPSLARGEEAGEALFVQPPAGASLRQRLQLGGTPDRLADDGAHD
jgi:hypothetical protein